MATKKSKGQFMGLRQLTPTALAIIALVIVVGVGSLILSSFQTASAGENTITDEKQNTSATSLPTSYILDEASTSDFLEIEEDSETVVYQDTSAATNTTLTKGTDYSIDYQDGNVTIKNSTTVFPIAQGDVFWNDYTELETNDETGILDTGISALDDMAGFLAVIVVIVIAAVIFMMLRVVRGAGAQAGA